MDLVTVTKITNGGNLIEQKTLNIKELGDTWFKFLIHTNICTITPWNTLVNRGVRCGFYGNVYIVQAKNRRIIYDTNFQTSDNLYFLVKDFVNYVINKYNN